MQLKSDKPKSWIPIEGYIDTDQDRFSLSISNEKFGLRVFLAVVSSLFFLLIISYNIRMGLADWHDLPHIKLLWLNTAALILSSIALQWAKIAATQNDRKKQTLALLSGGFFTCLFLIGQILVWKQLSEMGLYLKSNPANSFFFLLTGLHGLHLIGGLMVWGKTSLSLLRNADVNKLKVSIELLAIYWHYLLIVWLIIFAMLLLA